jgi:dipeptidyl aminopeptidase/acylaminoacyl peptidase
MVTAIALGGKAQRLAAIVQRRDGSTDLIIVSRDGSPVTVATLNCDSADAEQAVPIALHYRLSDGTPVIGWLYLPPQSVRALLPLVTIPYGGLVYGDTPPSPDGRDLGDGFANVAAIVGHGYAVLLPSMPALVATDSEPLDFAAQVLPAVDAAIATGRIDSLRLGLWGHSFGAYNVAMILTQTARFAAAIVSNGPYDLASNAGTFTPWSRLDPGYGQSLFALPGWTETGQTGLGATPWANPKRYVANSVLYHADRITTPLLIVAADKDVASLQQSEILFSALYRQGKDAELLSYWGEDHVPVSPANIRDIHARAFAWFDDIFERASRSSR